MDVDAAIDLVIGLAHDYSLETRIRRMIEAYDADGTPAKTLVMSGDTYKNLLYELEGRSFSTGYFWAPAKENAVTFFRGLPILVKGYMPYGEVVVGV